MHKPAVYFGSAYITTWNLDDVAFLEM